MSKKGSIAMSVVALGAMTLSTLPLGQASVAQAVEGAEGADVAAAADIESRGQAASVNRVSNIEGTFNWNQDAVVDNPTLRRVLYEGVSTYLCGVHGDVADAVAGAASLNRPVTEGEKIVALKVSGDVGTSFVASIDECLEQAPIKTTLGCTCAGNPADGRASANAEVTGFSVKSLIERAKPSDGANTITFTAQDGYRVSLPLSYVMQRHSVIVTEVGGAAVDEALGCQNQLWLGATSARSFVRDIVSIEVTREDVVPEVPRAEGQNQPNVGVLSGGAIA